MKTIYEDNYILAVNKPFGMPCQKDLTGDLDLTSALQKDYGEVFLINRLDRPVGGIVLFAKDKKNAAYLSEQMQNSKIVKKYIAAVSGKTKDEKELTDFLVKIGRLNISKISSKDNKNAREAILKYKRLNYYAKEDISIIEVDLVTGRHHQIRAQMANSGHYIIGDGKYGKLSQKYKHIGLFSCEMGLLHPFSKEILNIKIEIPDFEPFSFWV